MMIVVIFGLYGVIMFFFVFVIYLIKFESFGMVYFKLFFVLNKKVWKDFYICLLNKSLK